MTDEPKDPSSKPPQPAPGRFIFIRRPRAPSAAQRRILFRRLVILLAATTVTFAFTTWTLVRFDHPRAAPPKEVSSPEIVVRAHIDALSRGDLRAAYDMFSAQYRGQVPFTAFRDFAVKRAAIFRARKIEFDSREDSDSRAVLDAHIAATDGHRYLGRYTLIALDGRWWIDDVHWSIDKEIPNGTTALLRAPPSNLTCPVPPGVSLS